MNLIPNKNHEKFYLDGGLKPNKKEDKFFCPLKVLISPDLLIPRKDSFIPKKDNLILRKDNFVPSKNLSGDVRSLLRMVNQFWG
jgi:hypothetical protein